MIYLGADKHGLKAINLVTNFLRLKNIEFINLGVQEENQDIKLEKLIPDIVTKVLENKGNQAIISCGTGVGVEVGINKFSGIRACLAQDERVAEYARVYDDCNVLCLVGWEVNDTVIDKIMNAWLGAKYDGDEERLKMFETFNTWGGKV